MTTEQTKTAEGWVLVPVEPTKAMRRAGVDAWQTEGGHLAQMMGVIYRAMLAAAPKAPPADPAQQATKGDYCAEKLKPGGCQLHNLHCGYPKCNEAPALAAQQAPVQPARAERWCNKCGYFGPDEMHQRPNGTGECGYLSTPRRTQPAAPVQPSTKVEREGLTDAAEEAAGRLGVAVALLTECLDPLEVSAAIIESEDGGQAMEKLIEQVRSFVAAVKRHTLLPAPTVGEKGEGK